MVAQSPGAAEMIRLLLAESGWMRRLSPVRPVPVLSTRWRATATSRASPAFDATTRRRGRWRRRGCPDSAMSDSALAMAAGGPETTRALPRGSNETLSVGTVRPVMSRSLTAEFRMPIICCGSACWRRKTFVTPTTCLAVASWRWESTFSIRGHSPAGAAMMRQLVVGSDFHAHGHALLSGAVVLLVGEDPQQVEAHLLGVAVFHLDDADVAPAGRVGGVQLVEQVAGGADVGGRAGEDQGVGLLLGGDVDGGEGPPEAVAAVGGLLDDAGDLVGVDVLEPHDAGGGAGLAAAVVKLLDEVGDLLGLLHAGRDDQAVGARVGGHAGLDALPAPRPGGLGQRLHDDVDQVLRLGVLQAEDLDVAVARPLAAVQGGDHLLGHAQFDRVAHEHDGVGPLVEGRQDDVVGVGRARRCSGSAAGSTPSCARCWGPRGC